MSVIVIPSSWQTARPSQTSKLVQKVARLYGLDGDDDAEKAALDFLDEAVIEMNTSLYDFMLIQQTGITLTEGEDEYTLAASFFKEKSAYLVGTDGKQRPPLTYLDYATYRRLYGDMGDSNDIPAVYSSLNSHADGKIYLAPKPDGATASGFTLSISYYRRIPLPSATPYLDVPQEVETTLLYSAMKRMAIHIQGAYHPDTSKFEDLQMQAHAKLTASDRRHPDEAIRFRLIDNVHRGRGRGLVTGGIYIR